jgi:Protein of unknown function (DUF4199)
MRPEISRDISFAHHFIVTLMLFMKNIVLRFGLLSGALSALLMMVTAYQIKKNGIMTGGEIYGYVGMVLSMLFVYLGVRVYRDRERHGSITFAEAFKVGGLIALISCICYVITWLFVSEYLIPDFMDKYIAYALDKMRADGAAEADIQKAGVDMEKYKVMYQNPIYRAGLTFIEPLPVALLMSLISAAILRKK